MNKRAINMHQPPVIPSRWSEEERRFAIRIKQLVETLFLTQQQLLRRVRALEEDKHAQI